MTTSNPSPIETAEPAESWATELEYILVSDKNSKVLLSTTNFQEVRKLASLIRSANGECTIFRALKA